MSKISILRPQTEKGYTALPNPYFNPKQLHPEFNLKDTGVLNHLLSKPDGWQLNRAAIGNACGICERTVSKIIVKLQKCGFMSHKRFTSGHTEWVIKHPDYIPLTSPIPAAPPVESPHGNFSHGTFSHGNNCSVLETNDLVETTEKTTNVADSNVQNTVINDPLPLPAQLSEPEKKAVTHELNALADHTLQIAVLAALAKALTAGKVKNPVGYTNVLVKKANNGTFTAPATTARPLSPLEKEKQAKQKLRDFMTRNLDKLKRDFVELKKDYIHISGLGNITRYTFNEYLASVGGAA